jgi:hypothetical protein
MKGNFRGGPGSRSGRPCLVCRHADCVRIEFACSSGLRSHYQIAAEYKVTRFSVDRHWKNHVSPARKAELLGGPATIADMAAAAAKEDRNILDYLQIMRSELLRLFLLAKERNSLRDASHIAQRFLETLEVIARLNGQLRQAGIVINNNAVGVVNSDPTLIMNDPQVIKMQSTIIRALARHPEARADVIKALRSLEPRPNGHADPVGLLAPVIDVEAANV